MKKLIYSKIFDLFDLKGYKNNNGLEIRETRTGDV